MPTIFTRIIDGDIPGVFVWRDDICVVFMSKDPLQTGHALVVPIAEVDHWLDLEPAVMAHLTAVAQQVGQAQMAAFAPARVGLMIAGLEVPHVHLHVVPMNAVHDLDFANAHVDEDPASVREAAERLREALRSTGAPSVVG